jgi:FPC/CPF motif-containing protein YcgG
VATKPGKTHLINIILTAAKGFQVGLFSQTKDWHKNDLITCDYENRLWQKLSAHLFHRSFILEIIRQSRQKFKWEYFTRSKAVRQMMHIAAIHSSQKAKMLRCQPQLTVTSQRSNLPVDS